MYLMLRIASWYDGNRRVDHGLLLSDARASCSRTLECSIGRSKSPVQERKGRRLLESPQDQARLVLRPICNRIQCDFWLARCGNSMMQAIINASKPAEAEYLLTAKPPALRGLSR